MSMSRIEDWVRNRDRKSYTVVAQQGAEPTPDEVAAFEQEIGFELSDEFREYLIHPLGGLVVEVIEALWPRPKPFDVGPAWSFCFGLYAYSLSPEAPEWISMSLAWGRMRDQGYPQYLPVLRLAGDADRYCLSREGQLVIWRHETPDEPDLCDETFFDAFARELGELDERKQRKLALLAEQQEKNGSAAKRPVTPKQ